MKLSVIIVNYNVKAYLEQCLRSVRQAMQGVDGDVWVVDNVSQDGSVQMVRALFPEVKVIANTENVGFSRANNQAIRESTAEHVVLLNPDTVVGEDVFQRALAFLDAHPRAGGMGVRMIDGNGRFLPESKRGLPTPAVAFYKISGLSRLFPRSKVFGRYHLGHLSEFENAPVEILSGACMFLRKAALDKVGLLDENFFMYGEDIDLSYRITLGGYENWYLAEAPIIHYKGESTKKSSVNYVFVFYNAMAIFARKHFEQRGPHLFSLLIRVAIYFSAAGAVIKRFIRRALLPVTDLLMLFTALLGSRSFAEHGGSGVAYAVLMLAAFALMGAYDMPLRLWNVVKGSVLAGLSIACFMMVYSKGPAADWLEHGMWLVLTLAACGLASRWVLRLARVKGFSPDRTGDGRVLAIGEIGPAEHALALTWQTNFGLGATERMAPSELQRPEGDVRLAEHIRKARIEEVVFCAGDLAWGRIIAAMAQARDLGVQFKIAQQEQGPIIGPSSIDRLDDLWILKDHAVSSSTARRRKRLLDIGLAVSFTLTWPLAMWGVRDRMGLLCNSWQVLKGRRTWVGYWSVAPGPVKLPGLRPGVVPPSVVDAEPLTPLIAWRMDLAYAKDYRVLTDLRAVRQAYRALGDGTR